MDIRQIEQNIISEFKAFDDWMDRYNYLIELGKSLPLIETHLKTDRYLISGCQSRVWLSASYRDGMVVFTGDSDAVITKGIISLLIRVLSHQTPDAILEAKLDFINEIGLKDHLSPTRSNGLVSMIKQMKLYALALKTKYEPEAKPGS
ncbi:MAG: SufE family protein [Bacteroidales bacterium]|nr:SufE family protein [Bacteroidales bacterium]